MLYQNIFTVNAWIVDSNGTFNYLSGYPKAFNSKNYNNDADKALRRAKADFHTTIGTLCTRDDRQLQTVTLQDMYGNMVESPFSTGDLPPISEPEPEPETPTEGEGE